jgi:hypothetical protein
MAAMAVRKWFLNIHFSVGNKSISETLSFSERIHAKKELAKLVSAFSVDDPLRLITVESRRGESITFQASSFSRAIVSRE